MEDAPTPSAALEAEQRALAEVALEHQRGLVRCASPMLPRRGGSGILLAFGDDPVWALGVCDDCPIVDQTALLLLPARATSGRLRLPGGDEFTLTWPPLQPGLTVDCTSIERVGRSVVVTGAVRFPSGAPAPNAFVRACRAHTWADERGEFVLETWAPLHDAECALTASYQHGASGVRSEAVALSLRGPHQGLVLTVPEYPQWTSEPGVSEEEACSRAAALRGYWREEMWPRPLSVVIAKAQRSQSLRSIYRDMFRPEVVAEAKLALSRMPPPCADGP